MESFSAGVRHLVVVFGDQLNMDAAAFGGFDFDRDLVWMAESGVEAAHVWSNKHRIAFFFSAMRHFRVDLEKAGHSVRYRELGQGDHGMRELLEADLHRLRPEKVICTRPGEWRVLDWLRLLCEEEGIPLDVREDTHFFDTPEGFREWAGGRRGVRLEFYYREMRKRHDILMTKEGIPEGGEWNFDKENRGSFGKSGPGERLPPAPLFKHDRITQEVIALVEKRFAGHPGNLGNFNWPVTRPQALEALSTFVTDRLPAFGQYQDAMWTGQPFLYHSLLSAALNVKLLDPREVILRAVQAYRDGDAPLNAVEGFIRQILGWREYVRGIYWWKMPDYLEMNQLGAGEPLPAFYWSGETPMRCLAESIGQTLEHGYAHHIQRLMVTGLYGLLLGVGPKALHEWYLAAYVDAVEWVELPNTIGMSQYADGGLMASKPYIASGKYLQRMSNYCANCPANPALASGKGACPFTTLYWDFLIRHQDDLGSNPRLALQFRNAARLSGADKDAIRERAGRLRANPSAKGLL